MQTHKLNHLFIILWILWNVQKYEKETRIKRNSRCPHLLFTWPCVQTACAQHCHLLGLARLRALPHPRGPLCPRCGCGRRRNSGWTVLPGVLCCCKPWWRTGEKVSVKIWLFKFFGTLTADSYCSGLYLAEAMRPGSKLSDFQGRLFVVSFVVFVRGQMMIAIQTSWIWQKGKMLSFKRKSNFMV